MDLKLNPEGRRRQFMQRKLHGKLMRKEARGGNEVKNQTANRPTSCTWPVGYTFTIFYLQYPPVADLSMGRKDQFLIFSNSDFWKVVRPVLVSRQTPVRGAWRCVRERLGLAANQEPLRFGTTQESKPNLSRMILQCVPMNALRPDVVFALSALSAMQQTQHFRSRKTAHLFVIRSILCNTSLWES